MVADMNRCMGEPAKMKYDPFSMNTEVVRCKKKPDFLIKFHVVHAEITLCEDCKKLFDRHVEKREYCFERIVWPTDCLDKIRTLRHDLIKDSKTDPVALALCDQVHMLDEFLQNDGGLPKDWRSYDTQKMLGLLRAAELHLRFESIDKELLPHVKKLKLYLDSWVVGPIAQAVKMVEQQAERE